MDVLLLPVSLLLGLLALAAFIRALGTGHFADPKGAAGRILDGDNIDAT